MLISEVKKQKKWEKVRKSKGQKGTKIFEGQKGGFRAGQNNCTKSGGWAPLVNAKYDFLETNFLVYGLQTIECNDGLSRFSFHFCGLATPTTIHKMI